MSDVTDKRKPGRPRLPADRLRTTSIKVAVTTEEREKMRELAGRQPLASYVRDKALAS